jgi:ribosome-binding factor A
MSVRKPSKRILRSLCAQVHPDDGNDPRLEPKRRGRGNSHRKAKQLCRQVADTLSLVLEGTGDDELGGLVVLDVAPAPDTSRMLVTVGSPSTGIVDPAVVLDRLASASGRLRAEVAAAITRRRAPSLAFRVALPVGRTPGD